MKQRLDILLVEQGLAASREKAKAMIMSGVVFVNGQREDKAGSTFDEKAAATIEIHGSTLRYVSRGGLKLEKAVEQFGFSLKDKVCRCWRFYRRIYGLHAAKRSSKSIFCRCRKRTA